MASSPKIIAGGEGLVYLLESGGKLRLPPLSDSQIPEGAEKFQFPGFIAVAPDKLKWRDGAGVAPRNLRESWPLMEREDFEAAVKGIELLNWNKEERYCPSCGSYLYRHTKISKRCPACGKDYFPRLNPAIVVLVRRGEEALLVHARTLKGDVHALVAGFVETGESLEECVAREVKEETSLEIEDIRYVGSQAWPYPFQLMMGFTARYKSGGVAFADGELTSGGFFTRGNLPRLPSPPSLTRRIIDNWVQGEYDDKI